MGLFSKPHVDMKIAPWTFIELEKTGNVTDVKLGSKKATKEEIAEAEIADADVDENEDDANTEDDSKQTSTNTEDESQTSAETNAVKEEADKATEDDNDEDDDDDEEDAISETSANVTCLANNSTRRYYLASKPSPVALPDGAAEYYLKLLSEEEIQCRNGSTTEQPTEL
jgi:hypothetical protein